MRMVMFKNAAVYCLGWRLALALEYAYGAYELLFPMLLSRSKTGLVGF